MSLKARNWIAVLYPENMVDDWLHILEELCVPAFVSPLHTPDVDEKKEHYHIMLMYDSPTTYERVLEDFQLLGNVKICKVVRSLVGSARYLCHLDHPTRQQFPDYLNQVVSFSGADYQYVIKQPKDSLVSLCDIFAVIDRENISCWRGFINYCRFQNNQLLQRLMSNTATVVAVKEYIREGVGYDDRRKIDY